MFTRAQGIKNLPGMHCDHVLQDKRQDRTRQDKVKLITELVFSFFISTNNGQQEAIVWNIDLWSRLRWFNFKSARFAVFETSGISGHADVWRPVCCGVSGQLAYLQTHLHQLAYTYGELAYVGEFDEHHRRVRCSSYLCKMCFFGSQYTQ